MPILRGFPPSNTISPSVRITEKDLSFIPAEQSFHRAALVGFCSKGPINQPTLITNARMLNQIFGYPHPDVSDPYVIYAGLQYLTVASELYVVRVGDVENVSDERAQTAEKEVDAAGSQISVVSCNTENYTFANDSFFRWALNGVVASLELTIPAGAYSASDLVDLLNDQLGAAATVGGSSDPTIGGIRFFSNGLLPASIGLETVWAYGPDASLELLSVQNDAYAAMGFGSIGLVAASTTGIYAGYPDTGSIPPVNSWDFTSLSGTPLNLQIVIDGTDNPLIDGKVQVFDLSSLEAGGPSYTTAEVATAINNQIPSINPGGFIATVSGGSQLTLTTLHRGIGAKLLVKSDSTAGDIFGFSYYTNSGETDGGPCTDLSACSIYGKWTGGTAAGTYTFLLEADSAGIDGNATSVVIQNDPRGGVFSMLVYSNGAQVESWGNLSKDQNSSYYVESYLALVSDYIRVQDDTSNPAPPLDGTYSLSGGTDGIPSSPNDQDTLLIGSALGYTGIYALSEPEQIDIDLVAVPGHSSTDVVEALIDLCQNYRMDSMAIVDPPFGLTVNEIVNWQNGTHPLNDVRFDSDFLALYWPWLKLRDTYNKKDVWVPPSGSIMAVYARSDTLAEPWFAPAGATRGVVPNITDVFSRPTLEERDTMYGNANCINPVIQFSDLQNFVVWGQKTMQRAPTALDRVNVRRLMFYIEKNIRSQAKLMLFDPHDDAFHKRFTTMASAILDQVKVGRGLYAYIIDCGWDINTPDVVDRNEFRARIGIQPVKAVEFIFIEFSINRTGSWTENTQQPYTA